MGLALDLQQAQDPVPGTEGTCRPEEVLDAVLSLPVPHLLSLVDVSHKRTTSAICWTRRATHDPILF